jgi:hypothetical protein
MTILDQISVLGRTVRIVHDSSNFIVEANFTLGTNPDAYSKNGWHFIGATGRMEDAKNIMNAFVQIGYALDIAVMSQGLLGLNDMGL